MLKKCGFIVFIGRLFFVVIVVFLCMVIGLF